MYRVGEDSTDITFKISLVKTDWLKTSMEKQIHRQHGDLISLLQVKNQKTGFKVWVNTYITLSTIISLTAQSKYSIVHMLTIHSQDPLQQTR
jgi:hypothetical protein